MELDPLNGLRGLAALHIVVYHFFDFMISWPVFGGVQVAAGLAGGIQMPLFFLLSGYSLALAYGRKNYAAEKDEEPENKFEYRRYFRNRCARILPVYYLTTLLALSFRMAILGHDLTSAMEPLLIWEPVLISILTVFCMNTWIPSAWNIYVRVHPVAWTVNTLWFFYLIFPFILPSLQTLKDKTIARLIVGLHLFQAISIGIYWQYHWGDYLIISRWPLPNVPIFIMGALAGLQELRHKADPEGFCDPNLEKSFLHDLLPWGICHITNDNETKARITQDEEENIWRRRADLSTALIILLLVFNTIAVSWGYMHTSIEANQVRFFIAHLQLMVIQGLRRDGRKSFLGRMCRTKLVQFLGTLSMTTYLMHFIVMSIPTFSIVTKYRYRVASGGEGYVLHFVPENYKAWRYPHPYGIWNMPAWMVPVMVPLVYLVSYPVYHYFEAPMRKLLAMPKPQLTAIPNTEKV